MQSFYQNKTFKKAQYVSEKKKKRAEHYFPAEHHISPVNLKGIATAVYKDLQICELKREQQRGNKILHTS